MNDSLYSSSIYMAHPMDFQRTSLSPYSTIHHSSNSNLNDEISLKKQSWLEFIQDSTGNSIKDEAFENCSSNEFCLVTKKDSNYATINPRMHSFESEPNRLVTFDKEKHRNHNANKPAEDRRRCAVCSDTASGYHYGVWSCEGCKAFFKRSIQGTNEYICPATNTCTIDKHRRKSCQACRLRRCYEVGMTKGTTRRERKHGRKAVSVCKISSTSQTHSMSEQNLPTGSIPSRLSITTNNALNGSSSSASQTTKIDVETGKSSISPNEFISILSQASRLNLPSKFDPNRSLDDQYFLQLLAKIFDQELVILINWAKSIPGYTESLTLDQQVTIIEQSWLDTLLLDIIERSVNYQDEILHFASDFTIPRSRPLSSPILSWICTFLFHIVQVFKQPRTTHEEFIALRATILINSIPSTITSTKSFRLLTNQIYHSVRHASETNPNVYQENSIRHISLLLQLPHIKMLSSKLMKIFLDMRSKDFLPQADLLLEMLDAQDTTEIFNNFSQTNSTSLNYSDLNDLNSNEQQEHFPS